LAIAATNSEAGSSEAAAAWTKLQDSIKSNGFKQMSSEISKASKSFGALEDTLKK
jgi:ketol-acid reductoisomerase